MPKAKVLSPPKFFIHKFRVKRIRGASII
jgi:hypothetical protein